MNNFKKILVHDRQHALAWMDIQIGNTACPRIIFELFTDICPKVCVACINNLNLCVRRVKTSANYQHHHLQQHHTEEISSTEWSQVDGSKLAMLLTIVEVIHVLL